MPDQSIKQDANKLHVEWVVLADPEALDAESGLPHLWHCLCDVGLVVAQHQDGIGRNGRRTPPDGAYATFCDSQNLKTLNTKSAVQGLYGDYRR